MAATCKADELRVRTDELGMFARDDKGVGSAHFPQLPVHGARGEQTGREPEAPRLGFLREARATAPCLRDPRPQCRHTVPGSSDADRSGLRSSK